MAIRKKSSRIQKKDTGTSNTCKMCEIHHAHKYFYPKAALLVIVLTLIYIGIIFSGARILIMTGWVATITMILMFATCVCITCPKISPLSRFKDKLTKYHKYFVLLTAYTVVIHIVLSLLRSMNMNMEITLGFSGAVIIILVIAHFLSRE